MGKVAEKPIPPDPPTKDQILERLAHWATELVAFNSARIFGPLTSEVDMRRRQINASLDRWLDEFNDQKGR